MKIGSFESKPISPAAPASPAAAASKTAGTAQAGAEPSTQVDLSSAASSLSASGSSGDGSFDTAKVERISQAIRDGKFTVNPEAIADKLIINAAELLGRSGKLTN